MPELPEVETLRRQLGPLLTGETIRGLEILDYRETHGFEVRTPGWRRQFIGRRADTPFHFGDDIKNISGATLSCAHLTAGAQRLLALHAQSGKGGTPR